MLESDTARVEVDPSTGCFDVLDKESGIWWSRDPFEQSPGEVVLLDRASGLPVTFDLSASERVAVDEPGGSRVRIAFQQAGGEVSLVVALTLEGLDLVVELLEVTFDEDRWELGNVLYPGRQFSLRTFEDVGYLAIPYGQGCLVPSERFERPPRNNFHQYDDLSWQAGGLAWGTGGGYAVVPVPGWNGLTMPWFGVVNGPSAVVALLDTPYDVDLDCVLNYNMQHLFDRRAEASTYPRIASASPRWRGQLGRLGYERRVTYRFLPGGTYVDMAKAFRKRVEEAGELRLLRDKVRANPNVEKLFGAVLVNIDGGYPWYTDYEAFRFTWQDVERIARDMHGGLGVERALVCTWGGYAKLPPESLPFDERMGTPEDLRRTVSVIQDDLGYLYCSYHGYPALLTHSGSWDPGEATRARDGSISGRWGGRSPRFYLRYAKENLPETLAATGQQADYSDMVTTSLYEDHDERHPLTRTDAMRAKRELFDYIGSLGVVTGSEVSTWWAAQILDYSKGGMYVGRLHYLLRYIHAPLFNLVYHDAMVTFDGTVGTSRDYEYSEEVLECLAYGVNPVFSTSVPYYPGLRDVLRDEAAVMSRFLRGVALDELVDHAYLDAGYNVQRTRYSSGAVAIVNTDSQPHELPEGGAVPARGYVLRHADGTVQRGQIHKSMHDLA